MKFKTVIFLLIIYLNLFDKSVSVSSGCSSGTCNDCCGNVECQIMIDLSVLCLCDAITQYFDSASKSCMDVNECETNNGGCAQTCTNTVGGFSCSCLSGYTQSVSSCIDINECSVNNGGCAQTCTNSDGGFSCSCSSGYTSSGGSCIDINECSVNNGGCAQTCTNTVGGFSCSCSSGYTKSVSSCIDVDECLSGNGGCAQICSNSIGDFICSCGGGYTLNGDGKTCDVVIGECATSNCQQNCNNIVGGGHSCYCNVGYKLNSDDLTCSDINECSQGNGGCSQICNNVIGSYTCSCNDGYNLNNDSKTCDDINECATGNGGCSNECMNTYGGYYCVCPSGFKLESNLKTCQDIDECMDPNICGQYTNCTNIIGSYNCSGQFQHFINAVIPSSEKGGEAIFIGSFGNVHENISLLIGGVDCPILLNTSSKINCNASPGKGTHFVNLSQNGVTFSSTNKIYEYQPVGGKSCYNNCTDEKHGTCNTQNGECICKEGYGLFDCSKEIKSDGPDSKIKVGNSTTEIINQEVNFQIYFKSLNEIDYNGHNIKTFNLQENWVLNRSFIQDGNNRFVFIQTIENNCKITTVIEEIKKDKQLTFAGTTFSLKSGLIKFTITISDYTYSNFLNTLKLELISSVSESENSNNQCNSKETSLETDNSSLSFNYIKISKNNKFFSARFLNRLISDGEPTYLSSSTQKNDSLIVVSLNLPHCVSECIIDPDFSVLVSPDFKQNCNETNRKWVIPVAVVLSIVCTAILGTAVFLIFKRNTTARIVMAKLKKIKN